MDYLEPLESILQVSVILARATLRRNPALRAVGVEKKGTVLFRRADVERVLGRLPVRPERPPAPSRPTEPARKELRSEASSRVTAAEAIWQSLPTAGQTNDCDEV
jgi:hypothetical protein